MRYIALVERSDRGSLSLTDHLPRRGVVLAVTTGFPDLVRPTLAVIRADAPRAIVPESVSVDPVRRAFVTLIRDDGAGPDGSSTGGLVSTTRVVRRADVSTDVVAAFAESTFPASSSSHTLSEYLPAADSAFTGIAARCAGLARLRRLAARSQIA